MIVRGGALHLPLADESVDLIVTSPPYFGLRSYRDAGVHYDGQIGSEATPQAFLEALWAVTAECWRVLKPCGSMFVNLGDKRSGSGGGNDNTGLGNVRGEQSGDVDNRGNPRRYPGQSKDTRFGRAKSKMLLPHRYAIGCEDGNADPDAIGWIVRQDIVWSKPNGLPESVRDRTRDAHEFWFHLCKQGDYFSAVDEIREPSNPKNEAHSERYHEASKSYGKTNDHRGDKGSSNFIANPLGKIPSSVWSIPTEPLRVPEHLGIDHFAAFPTEWPRRLILGFSPGGICTACGEGLRPHIESERIGDGALWPKHGRVESATGRRHDERTTHTHLGYVCSCGPGRTDTTPAVVLDPFGGTGTTAMVARALGRTGITVDLSADYCRLARWRVYESGHGGRVETRTNRDRQGVLL